ncbi:ABC transporter permease [Bacillus licheniformis]|jgi:peptide/nickel transport system permease protein|uniref:Oligopeptide ABC transporter (Permease) n=4 Tax=Bacillus subtilis group TaxID=653685 RepID=Q65LC9_BACLD|nr:MULTISPECIES: ABC transporter permease [Bacillus]KJD54439.1 diguanylate cyclase [Bacillus amyloliquefaciens]KUL09668.1 peptide ABC transporter permease [Bacillus licheniformis LMG 7559]KUL17261.1 peptide ABC transporter permease [Bacillus licheniformis LMG 6934]AAU22789.1 oligopeptide ABC transporter (permease) [Bacillus licheniformis DSM 13 = ATCC 14580]AAU40135.1 oligopeptide ABC transporter permease [Bacillus licheniformis DSM 13 = ATCC 14580]
MITYIIRRTLMSIPILFGITILSFAIMKAAPGDPMALMMDPTISAGDREKFIEKYGLDEPEHVQYLKWLGNMVQGDFGTSIVRKGTPVTDLIMARLPNTLLLMLVSTILALLISIPLGVLSARRPYSKLDYGITFTSFIGLAVPNFWLGLILIMFLAVNLGWFPTGGVMTLNADFSLWDRIHHLILPAFVLATADMAGLTRYTRSSMLDVLRQDYMRTARAKGFKENRVVYKHGLRNGLLPVITIFGLMIPSFIGGAVVTEQIFSWPGLGKLFVDSAFQRDYPVIMAMTVISATLVVIGNLVADILYAMVDPRIEY